MDINEREYLNRVVTLFIEEIDSQLIGIYLHGSLAMGCYHPYQSDIDVLIVVQDKLSIEQMKKIARKLLKLQESASKKYKLELSIVLEKYLSNFTYPTPFEFHYSEYHHTKYVEDEHYICGGYEDPDLAAHLVVTYHRGIVLYGKPIKDVIKPVDEQYYILSIVADVTSAASDITENPLYYTLNVCRVLYFLTEGVISSKKEAGEWGLTILPSEYHDLIQYYLNEYSGIKHESVMNCDNRLVDYANYMLSEIRHFIDKRDTL